MGLTINLYERQRKAIPDRIRTEQIARNSRLQVVVQWLSDKTSSSHFLLHLPA